MQRRSDEIQFGIVTAWPDEDWHSARLAEACSRRGDAIVVDPAELTAFTGGGGAVEVQLGGRDAASFDALLLVRGMGRHGDADVQFEIYRALDAGGALVMNRIDALLAAQDKLRTSWLLHGAGVATPAAAAAQTMDDALRALARLGTAVAKPLAGSLGEGLSRVRDDHGGRERLAALLARDGAVYLQAWVEHPGRDARLFVVGDRVEGAMERLAPWGEWRTNVECGATVLPLRPGRELTSLAVSAARALGLDWAGVDIVRGPGGPTVLEVNGNPSWAGILEATGEDMAEPIAEHVLARAVDRSRGRQFLRRRVNHG